MIIYKSSRAFINKYHYFHKISFYCYSMNSDSESRSETWRGVPMTEILGAHSPWNTPEFPIVSPSYNHTVLYQVSSNGSIPMDRPPKPHISQEKWDHEFVRMPCSIQSLYPVEDENGKTHLKKRWEIIQEALWKPIRNSTELANTILTYNTKFKNIWRFRALHNLFNDYVDTEEAQMFFDVTLPEIAKLALALPKLIQSPIPLLKHHKNHSLSLSQQQIASLLANAFFCTFPRRNTTKRASEYASYPHINFSSLYEASGSDSVLEKLKCLCHYFRRVCTKVPVGALTFSRRSVPPAGRPDWPHSRAPLAAVPLHVDSRNTIEDAHGLIQMDFANKYLGGGVLGYGCVQEEIRFVICPELLISMLFTEMLRPDEALIIIGCERYSKYTGYANSFQWAGDYPDRTPHDSSGRRRCAVLAVDALPFHDDTTEFRLAMINRELNKSWVGVSYDTEPDSADIQYPGVATGNWGCGAFGGTPQLKSLLQLMACAHAHRPIAYYTFGDTTLRDDLVNMYNVLTRNNVTVGQLYKYLARFSRTADVANTNLFTYLHQLIKEESTCNTVETEIMDTSGFGDTSVPELSTSLEKKFTTNSPDLFSQEDVEDSYQDITDKTNSKECEPSTSDSKMATRIETQMAAKLDENMAANTNNKMVDNSSNKMVADTDYEMAVYTNNKMVKNSDNSITGNSDIKITANSDGKMAANSESKMAANSDNKMAVNADNEMAANSYSSRLFDEMQKFDESNGDLNLNTSRSTKQGVNAMAERDSKKESMDCDDRIRLDISVEAKKKIGKKITDYFSKKSI